jgi:RNA polymerase sigma factor (sigma-70 family)
MGTASGDPGVLDAELARAAQGGDAASLGLLLERHRAGMRAVAIGLLGWGPDADDAVQDAMLVAVRRLGDLRDPAASGPWLRTVVRNEARMRLRARRPERPLTGADLDVRAPEPTPEEVLDGVALRDWVWAAVETLSEPLQVVVLLRYFSGVTSYRQLAAVCGVPVGTVRSRLSEARRRLATALPESAASAHPDTADLASRRARDAHALIGSAAGGGFPAALAELAHPELELTGPQGQRDVGHGLLVRIMDADLAAGVRQRPRQVTAGRRLTLLECDLVSPPWDPEHCPPGVLWLLHLDGDRIRRVRLFHPAAAAV